VDGFFRKGNASDPIYCRLRDGGSPHLDEFRQFVENLWAKYRGDHESGFLEDARAHFHQRFWEMRLWLALIDMSCHPQRAQGKRAGSDFYIELDGRKFWIEAHCPTVGDGSDAISKNAADGEVYDVPEQKIKLRYANAIRVKASKHLVDVDNGWASPDDGYILALSSSALTLCARVGSTLPYIVKAAYAIGHLNVPISTTSLEFGDAFYAPNYSCIKSTGKEVEMGFLCDGSYPFLAGIIHSSANFTFMNDDLAKDFEFLENSGADAPLPRDLFDGVKRWSFDGSYLSCA
jgi:hypothetical protein